MKIPDNTIVEEVDLQDRVWDTYLQGLLTHVYTPRISIPQEPEALPSEPHAETIELPPEPISILPPPEWSETSFQYLFFSVSEMALAAPLTSLREIVKYDSRLLRKLPGQPLWSQGIIDHRGEIINLVDPGTIIMTDYHHDATRPYRYIILTDIPAIGFLCHDIDDMSRLDPENIRWYQNRTKRPWLAGIHKQRLCTVIDIQRLLPNPSILNTDKQARSL